MNDDNEKVIDTKELPIVGFCVLCDKPIFIGDEYERVEYYGNVDSKRLRKKDLMNGLAHKHCLEEKNAEIETLHTTDRKHNLKVLILSIITGFIIALSLMLIFIFSKAIHLALAIIIPVVIGYSICSLLYVLFNNNRLGIFVRKSILKLCKMPIIICELFQKKMGGFLVIKIFLWILLVPLSYLLILVLILLSSIISLILFPIILVKSKK